MIQRLFIILALLPIGLFANFSADISINNNEMSLYDLLEMQVVLNHPEHYHPEINTIRGNLFQHRALSSPPFVLVKSNITKEKGKTILQFTLEPQRVGSHTLSLYEIPFSSDKGEKVTIISTLHQVKVLPEIELKRYFKPVLASLDNEYPIEISSINRHNLHNHLDAIRNENIAILQSKTLPWALFIGGLILTLLFLIIRQQPKKTLSKTVSEAIKRTLARRRALKNISQLSSITSTDTYYTNLTNTIREYIEEYHNLPATTTTTEEFLQGIAHYHSFDQNTQTLLSQFLKKSDQVKFAEHNPTKNEKKDALQSAENFINDTHLKR